MRASFKQAPRSQDIVQSHSSGGGPLISWLLWDGGVCVQTLLLYLRGEMHMMRSGTKPGVSDRCTYGAQRPRVSAGRHAPSSREPAQLRGPTKPASQDQATKEGRMTHASLFVGIDVSKTQLDLALRPGGVSWVSQSTVNVNAHHDVQIVFQRNNVRGVRGQCSRRGLLRRIQASKERPDHAV